LTSISPPKEKNMNLYRILTLIILLGLLVHTSEAEKISGKVIDRSGDPIVDASITLQSTGRQKSHLTMEPSSLKFLLSADPLTGSKVISEFIMETLFCISQICKMFW
jgi:hypothetical protein